MNLKSGQRDKKRGPGSLEARDVVVDTNEWMPKCPEAKQKALLGGLGIL